MHKQLPVGGQAVIEGVLMKSPHFIATTVRKENGSLVTMHEKLRTRGGFSKLFLIRGMYNLAEMLIIGVKALIWSGNQFGEDEEELSIWELILVLGTSIIFGILFFSLLPYALTFFFGGKEEVSPFMFNLLDSLIKILIFLVYLLAISHFKDVKRLFQYHGAEHMAVHCLEHEKELTVDNVRPFTTIHPRCGTSFLMIVFIISVLFFSFLPVLVMAIHPDFMSLGFWQRRGVLFPLRVFSIPIIAGISYEVLKYSDKVKGNIVMKLISLPGMALQKITTQKPDDSMIEVAIASLKEVLRLEKEQYGSLDGSIDTPA